MKIRREYFGIFEFLDVLKNNSETTIRLCEPCNQKCDTISSANVEIGKARNGMPRFITKDLRKAIMKRSRMRNSFLKNRTGKNKTLFTKQRN